MKNPAKFPGITQSGYLPLMAIIASTAIVIAVSAFSLMQGWLSIFQNLFYFPIIFACVYYPKRGFVFSVVLAWVYFGMVLTVTQDIDTLEGAFIRVVIFILVAAVITYLSLKRSRADHYLRESEERYSSLFDHNYSISLLIDPDTAQIIEANTAAKRYYGYPHDRLIGMKISDINRLPSEKVVKDLRQAKNEGAKHFFSTHYLASGEKRNVEVYSGPIRMHGKSLFYSIIHDITEMKRAENELVRSAEKFHTMADFTADWEYWRSPDEQIIYISPSCEQITGYSPEEFLVNPALFDSIVYPDDLAAVQAHNVAVKTTPDIISYEFRVIRRDKNVRWIGHTCRHVCDSQGRSLGRRASNRDITEKKQAEVELQKLASVIRHSSEFIGIATLDGKIIFLNDAGTQMLGIQPHAAIGMDFFLFIPEHLQEKIQAELIPTLLKQGTWDGDLQFRNLNTGDLIDVHAMTFVINDPITKKPQYIANVSLDITGRKRAEEALKTSEFFLTEAMNLAHIAHWELDVPTGTFTFNDRFYALYGTTAEREGGYLMPAEVYAREFVHPDDRNLVAEEISHAIQTTDPSFVAQCEHRIIRRDGEIRNIIVRYGITKDEFGRTVKTHGANQDITERKHAQDALHQANKKLNLLSSITRHDILNQMTALRGYLELSHDVINDPARLDEFIKKEEHAAETIERQITFTKEYQDLGVKNPAWQNISRENVGRALVGLPLRAVHVDIDRSDLEVFADPLFEKVFYNLIDNALRYGGDGMTTIRVFSQETDTGLAIVCEDDGVGITEEDKRRLFTKGFGKHTGLGLFLCREILSITGITIVENGVPGKGARFEITVPKGAYRFAGADNKK